MRWPLLFTALFSTILHAEEVTVTGYGKSVDEAVQNAKIAAIEQVAGTFVTSRATLEGDRYQSRTDQYNGGLVRAHEVLSAFEQDGLVAVRIKADVDTDKINSVIESSGAELTAADAERIDKSRDDYEKTRQIVAALDDPSQAFAVRVGQVTYRNRGEMTDISAEVSVVYSPKWYDDVRVMAQTIGRKVDIGSPWADALWGLAALTAIINPALPGTMFSIARQAQGNPKPGTEYMVCFGKDNSRDVEACYEIRHPFRKTTGDPLIRLASHLKLGEDTLPISGATVDTNGLYMSVWNGRRVYFSRSSKERTFLNPGIVLFRDGRATFVHQMTVPTDKLRQAGKLVFVMLAAAPPQRAGSRNP